MGKGKGRYGKKSKRRYNKKQKAKKRNRPSIGRSLGVIVPDRMMAKVKYTSRDILSIAAGVPVEYAFRGNDLYDPDYTGSGHQPMGHDQWTAFYTRFRVYGSKISVKMGNTGSTNATSSIEYAIAPANINTIYTLFNDYWEAPYSMTGIFATANTFPTRSKYISTAKISGVNKDTVRDDDNFYGLTGGIGTGATPVWDWYWGMIFNALDETATTTVIVHTTITYFVEYFDRQSLSQS